MTHILMIEDDLELAEILMEYLEQFDIAITIADDPYLGLSILDTQKFDLIILDLTLPGIDGLEVCKEIRKRHTIPIIISSARTDITDKVTALENGADDYLPKPYNPRELQARIMSLLRRQKGVVATEQSIQKIKDLILNEEQMIIILQGKTLHLTAAEYGILGYLMKKEGGVVSREELIYNIEAISEETTNKSIDVIIGRIRQKLGENPKEPKYIHAVRGVGYKFLQ
ncbi:response regulator transcription factor [Sulfurospirillum diekertiae]|uniref:Response regulator transcription factor n=1 Tax=Sulfurospirillum diekertiae TaxID=1854492 RepID=A0A290HF37_9BACT|nr:response regulator transcription factor [Sulfurospirillum diekertiae]ATB69851.1 two-component response regulator [Sulfurospirillum diekertiae]QIR74915.1 response regulator transcription factor [Sulfurospirillum diekertiae]QIR77580.1 response regulator transcription factor [Sulfurospirillum diekertiae]